MAKVKVKLLRPLNGQEIGKVVTYDKVDADRLEGLGAVQILGAAKTPQTKKAPAPANKKAPAPSNKAG